MSDEAKVEITVRQARLIRAYLRRLYPQLDSRDRDKIGFLVAELQIQISKIK